MTKNEKAHLEANYKMHVEHMLKAEDATKKNPGDKELEYAVIAHRNIVFGYGDAAVTVLMMSVDEDEAQKMVAMWGKEATDDYKRGKSK